MCVILSIRSIPWTHYGVYRLAIFILPCTEPTTFINNRCNRFSYHLELLLQNTTSKAMEIGCRTIDDIKIHLQSSVGLPHVRPCSWTDSPTRGDKGPFMNRHVRYYEPPSLESDAFVHGPTSNEGVHVHDLRSLGMNRILRSIAPDKCCLTYRLPRM